MHIHRYVDRDSTIGQVKLSVPVELCAIGCMWLLGKHTELSKNKCVLVNVQELSSACHVASI